MTDAGRDTPGKDTPGEGTPGKDTPGEGTPGKEKEAKGGTGPEGTIPESDDGVAAASADEASNFEPEEDAGGTGSP